ncbi:MAG: hypothetical protein LBR86_00805, partial [Tannerella sp.]|nr:hypothetical protein [Tannerella sp.]
MKHRIYIEILTILLVSAVAGRGQSVSLDGTWELSFLEQLVTPVRSPEALRQTAHRTIAATVPGNVELDLLAAELIHDPM